MGLDRRFRPEHGCRHDRCRTCRHRADRAAVPYADPQLCDRTQDPSRRDAGEDRRRLACAARGRA
ncbi:MULTISPECIES: 2Fe-2S iron-sulfur cluster-binding protein [Bradyrhizobium]|uniref:2Fe-2S iron-sulfur cluster-binding protein n=1 Tax=Bradyrhizobium TaxID=374 RepID=UPI0034E37DD9